jgi:hypothetical protein
MALVFKPVLFSSWFFGFSVFFGFGRTSGADPRLVLQIGPVP